MALIDTYKEYIEIYNQHRNNGDNASAARVANEIIKIAKSESARSDIPKQICDYYASTSAPVREWLASVSMVVPKQARSAGTETEQRDWFDAEVPKLTMRDVAGLGELKQTIMVNVLAPLSPKYSPIYFKYRKDVGVQLLMYGPPGTGKTHLVRCLAGTLGCKIAVVQVKDFMANLVGDGAKIIAEVFEQAKQYEKCIIFFDEIDALAASRDDDESRHTKEQLTTLLTQMDGFTSAVKPGQIRIIIAATNRPWVLDSAVKRGGRFETQMYVPLPDFEARARLVELALGKDESIKKRLDIPCAPDVTIEWLANKFDGFSGGDIKAICKMISNRPMLREICALRDENIRIDDCITREDCNAVIDNYINSITNEMLIAFDAYGANMSYADYIAYYMPKAKAARLRGDFVPPYVLRWLDENDF